MFTNYLRSIYENEELKALAYKHFSSTIQNWHKDCPEETAGITANGFNEKGLTLDSVKIKKQISHNIHIKLNQNILSY